MPYWLVPFCNGNGPAPFDGERPGIHGPAPLPRTVGSWGLWCLMWSASLLRRGAAGSDPRSDGGSPGVRTRVGKRSASPPAGRHASRRPEITDPWLAGLLARNLSRSCERGDWRAADGRGTPPPESRRRPARE